MPSKGNKRNPGIRALFVAAMFVAFMGVGLVAYNTIPNSTAVGTSAATVRLAATDIGSQTQPLDVGSQTVNRTGKSNRLTGLQNPLAFDSIEGFLLAVIDILLIFAVPLIILMIIYAGFIYVTAQGNEEKIKTATRALTWAIVGGVLILGARAILAIVQSTVNQIKI